MSKSDGAAIKGRTPFLLDVLFGVAIGMAFIIPGFSGGSIAAMLGIYEKLVGAIADLFKNFKKSLLTLLPIALGMALGVIALLFPLGWALEAFPIPTVCIFVGLALGALPSITEKLKGRMRVWHIASFLIPLLVAFSLSFLPISSDVDLFNLDVGGYVLLVLVGLLGSTALVVPGISGSMLLLILGYYNPIVNLATEHLLLGRDVGISIAVLGCTALGIGAGFFIISIIMKKLLHSCPKGTYFAILGFILGSLPTVFISTAKESGLTFGELMPSAAYWVISAVLLAMGIAVSLFLVKFSRKKKADAQNTEVK